MSNILHPKEAYAIFIIAQVLQSLPFLDDSLDYEDVWRIATNLLDDFKIYIEEEDIPILTYGDLKYSLVENWINNSPVERITNPT